MGRRRIEREIREVLAMESRSFFLSDRLFSPDGLFNQLAGTEEERRTIARSPLFRQAHQALTALQEAEARDFAHAVEQAQAAVP